MNERRSEKKDKDTSIVNKKGATSETRLLI